MKLSLKVKSTLLKLIEHTLRPRNWKVSELAAFETGRIKSKNVVYISSRSFLNSEGPPVSRSKCNAKK